MRTSIAVAAALLGASASASGHHHEHMAFHKRLVATGSSEPQCSTIWTTWYGEPTMVPLPPPSTTSTTTSSSSTSTSAAPMTTSSSSSSSSSSTSTVASSTSQSPAASPVKAFAIGGSGTDFFGHSLGSSGMNGITYSPYQGADAASSGCKDADTIASDIQAINSAGFNRVRIYATDCGQLEAVVGAASNLGMKVIAGIFPKTPSTADQDFADQLQDLQTFSSSASFSAIDSLLVANEPTAGGHATMSQVASYLQQAKAAFPSLQVSVALTPLEAIQYCGSLAPHMDMLAAQIHPFFASVFHMPSASGDYVATELAVMQAACGGMNAFVSESGYPSGGGSGFAGQQATPDDQSAAVKSLQQSSVANHITMFSSSTDTWKLTNGVEPYEAAFNCLGLF